MCKNPILRNIAKIMLNSFLGKVCSTCWFDEIQVLLWSSRILRVVNVWNIGCVGCSFLFKSSLVYHLPYKRSIYVFLEECQHLHRYFLDSLGSITTVWVTRAVRGTCFVHCYLFGQAWRIETGMWWLLGWIDKWIKRRGLDNWFRFSRSQELCVSNASRERNVQDSEIYLKHA